MSTILIKSILGFSVTIVAILSSGSRSHACSCISTTPCEAFKNSSLVFVGHLIKVDAHLFAVEGDTTSEFGVYFTFEVERIFKGGDTSIITVVTGMGGGDCGYHFESDQT